MLARFRRRAHNEARAPASRMGSDDGRAASHDETAPNPDVLCRRPGVRRRGPGRGTCGQPGIAAQGDDRPQRGGPLARSAVHLPASLQLRPPLEDARRPRRLVRQHRQHGRLGRLAPVADHRQPPRVRADGRRRTRRRRAVLDGRPAPQGHGAVLPRRGPGTRHRGPAVRPPGRQVLCAQAVGHRERRRCRQPVPARPVRAALQDYVRRGQAG